MTGRSSTAVLLAVLVALAVAAVDVFVPPPTSPAVATEPLEATEPVAGSATCVVGQGREGVGTSLTVARPPATGGDERPPSELELVGIGDGDHARVPLPSVEDEAHVRVGVGADADQTLQVEWRGSPVTVTRTWRITDAEDLPPGTVAGACPTAPAARWVLPGMSTVGGDAPRIRVANPYRTDATVAVGFVTPEGPEEPLALQNLSIPPRSTLDVDVVEHLPERADLAAVVRLLSGRAVVEGYQLARSEIGGIDGASLLSAATAPAEAWTVPWLSDTDTDDSWLWVLNLGDRPAPVELTLHTEQGGVPPEGLSEVTVAPGQVRRIDLRGTFPEEAGAVAVTARSEGTPVYVAGAVQRSGDEPDTTGLAVQLGTAPATGWVVGGGTVPDGRRERLQLVNPGSEPAVVDVVLHDGERTTRPAELAGVELGPGERRSLVLDELVAGAEAWSAFVTTTEGEVVVGRLGVGGGGGGAHLVAVPGARTGPDGGPAALPGRAVPGSVQRWGTAAGG
jgi:hypothetical protein